MTTFQDLPPQSRRSARQSERGERPDTPAGFNDFTPQIEPVEPESPVVTPDASLATGELPPATGRRARPSAHQGLFQVPAGEQTSVDQPAAEPLEYSTQGRDLPDTYRAPEPQQQPQPQFRVRDFSPEGRASGRRAATPPLIEPPVNEPQSSAASALPADLDYRTLGGPIAPATPIAPADQAPISAPVPVVLPVVEPTADASAPSATPENPTLSRRELRAKLARDEAALLTGPQDPALLTGPQSSGLVAAPVLPAAAPAPIVSPAPSLATAPPPAVVVPPLSNDAWPQAPAVSDSLTTTPPPATAASLATTPPPASLATAPPPASLATAPPPASLATAPPPASLSTMPPPASLSTAPPPSAAASLATAPPPAPLTSPVPASLATTPPSQQANPAPAERAVVTPPPASVTPTFIEPELAGGLDPALEQTGGWVAPAGHWSRQADLDDEMQDWENTVTREVGGGNVATTTSALVLPEMPLSNPFPSALTGTGEILLTGSIDLPRSLSSGNGDSRHFDDTNVDLMYDDQDSESAGTDSAPVSAIRAVSTHTSARGVINSTKPTGNRMLTVLLVTASVMAVGVVVLLVAGLMGNVF